MTSRAYAEVALGVATPKLFHYRIPPSLEEAVTLGRRVLVPLGRRFVVGYVVGLTEEAPPMVLKDIQEAFEDEPPLDPHLIELTRKVADEYLAPRGEVIKSAFPPSRRSPGRWVFRLIANGSPPPFPLEKKIWEALQFLSPLSLNQLQRRTGVRELRPALERMQRKGWVAREMVPVRIRAATRADDLPAGSSSPPLPEKEDWPAELAPVQAGLANPGHQVFLLFGIPWNVRVRWYRRIFDLLLQHGKGALLLVPEISSASTWVEELGRPYTDHIALLHSDLSSRERTRQWTRIQEGAAPIVVATRSAAFIPHPGLALIVIEDEQDPSYKQQEGPHYDVREVALIRARMLHIPLLLASRTPSVESFYRAQVGEYHLLAMAGGREGISPRISLVDMRNEVREKTRGSLLSSPLREAIGQSLAAHEQAILLINRRGYFAQLLCRDCGFQLQCPRCSVPFVLHWPHRRLICHQCGSEESAPDRCPSCRGLFMRYHGAGTQQVEEELRRLFPEARVARLDRDLSPARDQPHPLHLQFGRGEIDILVGTQMVIRAVQHGRASLVGVLAADNLLSIPDFRAGERLFSLLMAMVPEGGAEVSPSHILVQTYNPGNYVLQAFQKQDWDLFYQREITSRRELSLPPFLRLALVEISAKEEEKAKKATFALASLLQAERPTSLLLDGPAPSPHLRVKGRFHWRLLVKGERAPLLDRLQRALTSFEASASRKGVVLRVDVDPVRLY
jgi:primosomal protein N' (replication factor Y) (superfamily II helicase)